MSFYTSLQSKFSGKVGDPVPEFNTEYVPIREAKGSRLTKSLRRGWSRVQIDSTFAVAVTRLSETTSSARISRAVSSSANEKRARLKSSARVSSTLLGAYRTVAVVHTERWSTAPARRGLVHALDRAGVGQRKGVEGALQVAPGIAQCRGPLLVSSRGAAQRVRHSSQSSPTEPNDVAQRGTDRLPIRLEDCVLRSGRHSKRQQQLVRLIGLPPPLPRSLLLRTATPEAGEVLSGACERVDDADQISAGPGL